MNENILKDFALNSTEISVLSTIQRNIILSDITHTEKTNYLGASNEEELKNKKREWLYEWEKHVVSGFEKFGEDKPRFLDLHQLDGSIKGLKKLQAGLILLEATCFVPYWPFSKESDVKQLGLVKDKHNQNISDISEKLGFENDMGQKLRLSVVREQDHLTGYWDKVLIGIFAGLGLTVLTAGIAAPYIAGAVGASMGLSGAAAVTAGLAAIGGGSVAAGGFGMAGGMALIVGGGGLLGAGTGLGAGHYLGVTAPTTVLSASKLQVVLKEFILQNCDVSEMQRILFAQRNYILELNRRIDELRLNGKQKDEELEQLLESVKYLEKSVERNRAVMIEAVN
ncbi:MAG TPA: hypothetical protein DCG57_13375 [Candidatus Riflebacteria bacterium]|jgi:hypothetical protein|nr:hypothetical protein [Candidatus Riflebacteria bacterium]